MTQTINNLTAWLSSAPFLHLAGMVTIAVLMGTGTLSVTEGLPLLAGLIGLGIQTTSTASAVAAPQTAAPVPQAPPVSISAPVAQAAPAAPPAPAPAPAAVPVA